MRVAELLNEQVIKNTGSYPPALYGLVKQIQTNLVNSGYDVGPTGIDGKYGPRTEAAVRKYQKDKGIKVDGVVGPETMKSLNIRKPLGLQSKNVGFLGDPTLNLDITSKNKNNSLLKLSGNATDMAAELIKKFEGYYPKAYWDYKQWTIGYGSKAKSKNETIDRPEAERRLRQEMAQAQNNVLGIMKKGNYTWSDKQLAALISFAYNIGSVNQLTANGTRDDATILAKIPLYRKAGGKVLQGLVNRRSQEAALFKSGMTNA